jgi:hypothetical protein
MSPRTTGSGRATSRPCCATTSWASAGIYSARPIASKRERGIDLLLERDGGRLAIEVKGFPGTVYARGPKKGEAKPTQPALQAKHWFAEALLSAIQCKSRNPGTRLPSRFRMYRVTAA